MDSEWVKVDAARNVGEAALLRAALEANDIEVTTRGEHLPSIAGELPFTEAQVELWVRGADADRARDILANARAPQPDLPARACPKCDEENPGNFELCWQCEWPLPASATPAAAAPSSLVRPREAPRNTLFWVGAALLMTAAAMFFVQRAHGATSGLVPAATEAVTP